MNTQKHTDKVKDVYPALCIFSAFQDIHSFSTLRAAETGSEVEEILARNDVPFKKVPGCYKGIEQDSYIVAAKHEPTVLKICFKFLQDSYLNVDQYRNAEIVTVAGGHFPQGKLQRISKAEAIEAGNWTLDGSQYWGTK